MLLDRKLRQAATLAWFEQKDLAQQWSGAADDEEPEQVEERARDHWAEHVQAARDVALGGAEAVTSAEGPTALGRMPDDLVEVLAQLAIGGPAVTMFRALLHVVGGESSLDDGAKTALRNGAGRTAWAFRALFNQPEVMALLRGMQRDQGAIPTGARPSPTASTAASRPCSTSTSTCSAITSGCSPAPSASASTRWRTRSSRPSSSEPPA